MTSRSQPIPYEDFFTMKDRNNEKRKYQSSSDEQATWSPSWITSNNYQREYYYSGRNTERTERRAMHMELPRDVERKYSVSQSPQTSFGEAAGHSPSLHDDYPFFFSDPVDNGSVQTGMSQQELLRKKARESKKQTRFGKPNKTKRKKPVVQITGFLSSRASSQQHAYTASTNLPNAPRKPTEYSSSRKADMNADRWPRGNQYMTHAEDIELSTAETTLTDTSSRHRTKNPSSPLRVVLDGGDLMLTARQKKFDPDFAKLDVGENDFPLLSRSASDSFQIETSMDPNKKDLSSSRAHLLNDPPSLARERFVHHQVRSNYGVLQSEATFPTRLKGLQSRRPVNEYAPPEWISRSKEKEKLVEKKDQSKSVRFRDEIIRASSFNSHSESEEVRVRDRIPKSILREPRYRMKNYGALSSSSPSQFFIRKPATPERNELFFSKKPPSAYSPSGVLDETRRFYSPLLNGSQNEDLFAPSDEPYPDPPLDSVNIDDDDTTFASRNDAFLETIAAIVIQAAVRRFLAMRYVDRLTENVANETHAKYVTLSKKENEKQVNTSSRTPVTSLLEPPKNHASVEKPKLQALPSRPPESPRRFVTEKSISQGLPAPSTPSPHRANSDRRLENNLQQKRVYDMYDLAAIRIQATFRGFWARDSLDVDHFCATLIQRCVRRYLCEQKYRYGHYHVFRYVVRIQSIWRGVLARQNLHRSIGASILIQAYARGFLVRRSQFIKNMNSAKRIESLQQIPAERPTKSTGNSNNSWQKGLASDLWRQIRMLDNQEGKAGQEEQKRSSNYTHLRKHQTKNGIARLQFQSAQPSTEKELSEHYYRPTTSKPATLHREAMIQTSAAVKIQSRFRTYICERKLIRSLVDILIVQTVVRRWLAKRRASRLRTLRDRCQLIVKNGDPKQDNVQSVTAPRLVSRSEFFQNRIVLPDEKLSNPHFAATTSSRPSFNEDECFQQDKNRQRTGYMPSVHASRSTNNGNDRIPINGYYNAINRSASTSSKSTTGLRQGTDNTHGTTDLPQWANMTLRPTKSNGTIHETSTYRFENRTPPQLTGSSDLSESRIYTNSSYESKSRSIAEPATQATVSSGRRQVVVTPPVLLKKNTDRKILRR